VVVEADCVEKIRKLTVDGIGAGGNDEVSPDEEELGKQEAQSVSSGFSPGH
jgi:hypothetical protein